MDPVTLFEYESKVIDLSQRQIRALQKLQQGTKAIVELNGKELKATSYVGVIQLPGLTIQVLPKLYRGSDHIDQEATRNLLHLLQYTKKLFRTIKQSELSNLQDRKTNFFEVLIYLFASHLIALLKLGIHRTYLNLDDQSVYLKGSWRLSDQLARNSSIHQGFYITYDEFTENNSLNRILKFVSRRLAVISQDKQNTRILREITLMLPDVDDLQVVYLEDLDQIHFSRLNDEYRPVFELAKLFLSGLSIELAKGTNTQAYAFVFDMNALFEEFVVEFLKKEGVLKNGSYADCAIRSQSATKYLVRSGESDFFQLKPDIRFERSSDTCCIIDTKYKLLSNENKYGISQNDMYQMYAYSKRYTCPRVLLLYPEHNVARKIRHGFDAYDTNWIEIHTVDISKDISKSENRNDLKRQLQEILEFRGN